MALRCKQHLHILGSGIEDRREAVGRHVDSLDTSEVSGYQKEAGRLCSYLAMLS